MKFTVKTPDGRQLATQLDGDPEGRPIFLLHGTPGSRLGPRPRSAVLHRLGVQLISFDRPGYGESDRLEGRRVADAAADVLAIADAYGLDRFAVVGRSGGGPHALACAALLPDRLTRAAVLVGIAPRGAEGLGWYDGMTRSNVLEHTAAADGYEGLAALTEAAAEAVRADPASLLTRLQAEMPDPDLRVVADRGIRAGERDSGPADHGGPRHRPARGLGGRRLRRRAVARHRRAVPADLPGRQRSSCLLSRASSP